ncbi:MAG: MBL fold metallo-hydrolase [Gammaproteobacteria bacterium]|nr:MBL fold metallo-hydrolase [Gammaproteobacteria bacterium]
MKASLAGLLATLALGTVLAQEPAAVEFTLMPVADGLFMLKGQGGNIGLSVGADGVFMIDDQYAPLTDGIKVEIAKISDQPVRFLINTHWHGDHTGGNENLGKTGTVIVAHENVRHRMSSGQIMTFFEREIPASPVGALPVITFDSAVTFHLNGDDIRAIHVEHAHTDGDAIIHFPKANVIHSGDVVFNGQYPFIDLESGGSVNGVIAAVDTILALCDDNTKIIPGHGVLANVADLRVYRSLLANVRDRVAVMVAQGKTLEEVQAAGPSAEFDDKWGNGFMTPENFVREIYLDQTR